MGLVLVACLWDWGAVLPRMWPAARWVLLVVALIALNLASAVSPPSFNLYELTWSNRLPRPPRGFSILFVGDFRPSPPLPPQPIEPPPGTHLELNYTSLFDDIPRVLNLSIDGTLVQRCAMEVNLAGMKRLPEVIFQGFPIGEATIDFRADGSVAGYAGRPGIKPSFKHACSGRHRFRFWKMRWPRHRCSAVKLTLLFLIVTVRRLNPRQIRTLVIVVTLSGINLAGAFAYFAREKAASLELNKGRRPRIGTLLLGWQQALLRRRSIRGKNGVSQETDADRAAEPAAVVPANLVADHDQRGHHAPGPRHPVAASPASIDRGGECHRFRSGSISRLSATHR